MLQPFKYAGYMQLMEVVTQQEGALAGTAASSTTDGSSGGTVPPPAGVAAGPGNNKALASIAASGSEVSGRPGQHGHFLAPERVQQVQVGAGMAVGG